MLGTGLSAAPSCSAGGQERAVRRVPSLMDAAPQAAFFLPFTSACVPSPEWSCSAMIKRCLRERQGKECGERSYTAEGSFGEL